MAVDILFAKTPLLSTNVVSDARDFATWEKGGKDVSFITFEDPLDSNYDYLVSNKIGDSRTGVASYALQQDSYTETLQEKTISIDLDGDLLTDTMPDSIKNFYADLVARKSASTIQRDLLNKAEQTDLVLDVTGESTKTLTCDYILDARMKWGEHANSESPSLFISAKQYKDLAKTSDFKTFATGFNRVIADSTINAVGPIATIHGVSLYLCDAITLSSGDYTAIMAMPNALGLFIKDARQLEPIRHAGTTVLTWDFNFRWASTLYRRSPRPTVKLITE